MENTGNLDGLLKDQYGGKRMAKPDKNAPLGSGGRFAALKQKLSGQKGVYNPGGLAAAIGRKKFGKKGFQKLSAQGRRES